MASLADKLAEYDKLSSEAPSVPEAGWGHYLARAGIHGISALADVVPNLYNLVKAGAGTVMGAAGAPAELLPQVGEANPIDAFLQRGYRLDEPVTPSASVGGKLGAAIIEGAGSAAAQGPMGLLKAAPLAMAKQLLAQEAKNAVLGAAAGGGAELGGEATGGSAAGQLGGGILAGVIAPATFIRNGGVTVGAVRSAMQTARDMRSRAPATIEPGFTNYVNSTVKGAVAGAPNAAENLTEGLRLRESIPGFNPSVAEMANAPGLVDMQKKFAMLSPENLNAEVARNGANQQAIQNYYRGVVPEAKSPGAVRSSVNQSLADYEKLLEDQARGVAGKLPAADQLGLGTKLSEVANAEKKAAKPGITAAYQKAFDEAGDSTVSGDGIVGKVEQILGEPLSQIKPSTAPQTVSAIQRIFGDKTKELTGRSIPPDMMALSEVGGKKDLTLQDLHDIRVAIGQDVASASRSADPAAATRLYNLGQVLPEVDAAITKLPASAQDAYAVARAKYRDEYAPRFKTGTAGQVFRSKSISEPRILPDKFVSEFFKTDAEAGITRASQFTKLFGQNQEAKDAARTGILDIYRQKAVNPTTGAIEQSAHDRFMRDYGRTLDAYKANGVDASTEIKRVGQEAAKVTAASDNLRALAKTLKFDTVDELASDALKNSKTMGNTLMRLPADKRATFNTILLDKAFESGTASGMREFLEGNQKTLGMTVPKEQLSAMHDIAKALELTERAPIRGNLAAGGADMLKNATGTSTATVFSQIRAVTGGRSSVEWAAINLAMPALNKMTQTSFANVMENALHSQQSAVALRNYLLSNTPNEANKWATQLLNGMKMGGKLVWSARGPITSNFLGPQRYPENLARTGSAIRSQVQQETPQ